jgi:hypothetical protein
MTCSRFLLSLALFFSVDLFAAKFANTYIEFDLPDSWHCQREGGQHVCQPINPDKRREAIIVMASKYKGPDDTVEKYSARLKAKRTVKDMKGKPYDNIIQFTRMSDIQGNSWVDSQQENSEIPGYITRYLATVKSDLGVVITFSAFKSKFKDYSADFYKMINSIRVRANIPAPKQETQAVGSADLLGSIDVAGAHVGKKKEEKREALVLNIKPDSDNKDKLIIGGAIAAILLLFLIMRRRRG